MTNKSINLYFCNAFLILALSFFFNSLYAAEGGPCKDYGECDKFKYSLNDIVKAHQDLEARNILGPAIIIP